MNEKRQTEITGSFAVNRGYRLLYLYQKLMQGGNLQKKELAERFGVSEKTVQRDIDDLRAYMADSMIDTARPMEIRYSKSENAYVLDMSEEENILETEVVRIGRAGRGSAGNGRGGKTPASADAADSRSQTAEADRKNPQIKENPLSYKKTVPWEKRNSFCFGMDFILRHPVRLSV